MPCIRKNFKHSAKGKQHWKDMPVLNITDIRNMNSNIPSKLEVNPPLCSNLVFRFLRKWFCPFTINDQAYFTTLCSLEFSSVNINSSSMSQDLVMGGQVTSSSFTLASSRCKNSNTITINCSLERLIDCYPTLYSVSKICKASFCIQCKVIHNLFRNPATQSLLKIVWKIPVI
jgi:hypothetical protein